MDLLFATHNLNKVKEIAVQLPKGWRVLSLYDLGFVEHIPETSSTLEGNAEQKARFLYKQLKTSVLAEDTGLEVEALGGEPGVFSARYAGPEKNMDRNMEFLLQKLKGVENRKARFKTVIALILNDELHYFTGTLNGTIGFEKKGSGGFGYDPVFVLDDGRTLAELSMEEKSQISHRGEAVNKLLEFLRGRT